METGASIKTSKSQDGKGKVAKFFKSYWFYGIPVLILFFTALSYCLTFGFYPIPVGHDSDLYAKYGQFGDFFGGIVNPLLAFINIAMIVYFQRDQANKIADREAFFRMIEFQNQLTNSIEITASTNYSSTPVVLRGRSAFAKFNLEAIDHFQEELMEWVGSEVPMDRIVALKEAYHSLYETSFRLQDLGHYFRHMYLTMKFLDNLPWTSVTQKSELAKILRAQLSHVELKFLFLNCLSGYGVKFREYCAKYDLLEWIADKNFIDFDESFNSSEIVRNEIDRWKTINYAQESEA